MVNLNPPQPPEMQVIDGIKVRPEDVERVKELNERRTAVGSGVQDPVPVGVAPAGTDNRRRTQSELYDGEPFDPATQILTREEAPDAAAGESAKAPRSRRGKSEGAASE